MSFVLQSLEILETNQLYQLRADTKPTKVSSDDTQVSELLTLINKQTNDLGVARRWERKNQKFMAINFVTVVWNITMITKLNFEIEIKL